MTVIPNTKLDSGATEFSADRSIAGADHGPDPGASCRAGRDGLDAYTYGLLDPRAGAAGENLPLLGATTLGIEVTVPELARRCGLGNIDPQHSGGIAVGATGAAAIEACLTVTPPPVGSTLVTVRPDLDAFGAMALFALRCAGHEPGPDMWARIDRIARADRFDHDPWPGPRPMPGTVSDFAAAMHQDPALIAVTGAMFDRELSARERVGLAADWMVTGVEPPGYRERWTAHAQAVIDGLACGAVVVESTAGGRIATVTSRLPGSLRLGYCLAPVVVAHDPGTPDSEPPAPRRVVIAQYAPGHIDLAKVRETLVRRESGWGGSNTILGSPQGRACGLGLTTIVDMVLRNDYCTDDTNGIHQPLLADTPRLSRLQTARYVSNPRSGR